MRSCIETRVDDDLDVVVTDTHVCVHVVSRYITFIVRLCQYVFLAGAIFPQFLSTTSSARLGRRDVIVSSLSVGRCVHPHTHQQNVVVQQLNVADVIQN